MNVLLRLTDSFTLRQLTINVVSTYNESLRLRPATINKDYHCRRIHAHTLGYFIPLHIYHRREIFENYSV